MLICYHVDNCHEHEEKVEDVKSVLDCLRASTRIWLENKLCRLDNIDYNVVSGYVDVWMTKIEH